MSDKIPVDAEALRDVLVALVGQDHLIRELQVARDLDTRLANTDLSPISKLLADFNKYVENHNCTKRES